MITIETAENLLGVSEIATREIFEKAQDLIDSRLGNGYSSKNPQLLSSVIITQSHVYTALLKGADSK